MPNSRAQKFSRLIVTVPRLIAEPYGAALVEVGAGAVEERPTRHADTVEIVLSLPVGEAIEPWQVLMRQLYQVFSEELPIALDAFTMRTEHYELDYHGSWLRHLTVARISPHLALAPVDDKSKTPEGCDRLLFTPHPSFGDGTHVTTRLAATAIENAFRGKPGGRLLDVGTGNGVLCLVAAHYGAEALGIDIDSEAIESAKENARTNGLYDACQFETTPLANISESFKFVVANLEPLIQLELGESILPRVCPGGRLWLTGFLPEQADAIVDLYTSAGFTVESRVEEELYVLLSLVRSAEGTIEAPR